jgi:hypothetical protein
MSIVVPAFTPTDVTTWPETLTADQVAAIYQRKPGGLKKCCQERRFVPAPFLVKPYRWRKVDVLRHVQGARGGAALYR